MPVQPKKMFDDSGVREGLGKRDFCETLNFLDCEKGVLCHQWNLAEIYWQDQCDLLQLILAYWNIIIILIIIIIIIIIIILFLFNKTKNQ